MSKKKHAYSRQTEQILSIFGGHIRYARKTQSMSVGELAERLGVSRSTLQCIEKGSPNVAIGTYFEASILLGIELLHSETLPLHLQQKQLNTNMALLPSHVRKKSIKVKDEF